MAASCNPPVLATITFQIHTELFLHVQLSLLRDIFCVVSVEHGIYRSVLLRKIKPKLQVPIIIDRVK